MSPASQRHRVVGTGGAVVATAMAALWAVVVPGKAAATTGLQSALIQWGHPATWALLAGAGVAHALDAPRPVRDLMLWGSLASYGGFLAALAL